MPTRRTIIESHGVFFITITCCQWLSLIELTNGYDIVYKWFDYLKEKSNYIAGYVIMPNHLHALIAFRNNNQPINTIIGNGKRFMAYEIINRLEHLKETALLHRLYLSVEATDRKRNKNHEVWEDSFNWKECRTPKFMKQMLDYMHDNPCRGKWNLVADVTHYVHSSAKFYLTGEPGFYPITNYLNLEDIDLTKPVFG
jgi:REP element-mobilizing transposase RayT